MPARSQMAIIPAFEALWDIKFDQMAKVQEKDSRLWMLSSDFKVLLVSLFSLIANSIQWFHIQKEKVLSWFCSQRQ